MDADQEDMSDADFLNWVVENARESAEESLRSLSKEEKIKESVYSTVVSILDLRFVGETEGSDVDDDTDQVAESRELNRKLEEVAADRGIAVDTALISKLEELTKQAPGDVHTAFNLTPVGNETSHALSSRDEIEYILVFVPDEEIPNRIRGRIEGIDSVLYEKYLHECEYNRDQLDTVSTDYYPESFWWRHPKQFLPETGGPYVEMWHERVQD